MNTGNKMDYSNILLNTILHGCAVFTSQIVVFTPARRGEKINEETKSQLFTGSTIQILQEPF